MFVDIQKRARAKGVAWQVRWREASGQPYRYKTFDTQKAAQAFVVRDLKAAVEAAADPASHYRVYDAIKLWVDTVANVGRHGREPVDPATLRKYRERANNHTIPMIGHLTLAEFTGPRAIEWRDELLKRVGRPTAKKILTDLRGAIAEARTRGMLHHDPLFGIKVVDSARRARRPDIPTRAQMAQLEAAARARRDHANGTVRDAWARFYPLFVVLRWTGARPEEVRALRVDDVFARRGQVRIAQAADERGVIGPVKTANSRRVVDVPDLVADAVGDWLQVSGVEEGLLFPTDGGKPISLANLTNRLWYPILEDVGLRDNGLNLYSLRHFRISERLADREDLQLVSKQAGHADAGFTLRTYAHVLDEGLG